MIRTVQLVQQRPPAGSALLLVASPAARDEVPDRVAVTGVLALRDAGLDMIPGRSWGATVDAEQLAFRILPEIDDPFGDSRLVIRVEASKCGCESVLERADPRRDRLGFEKL